MSLTLTRGTRLVAAIVGAVCVVVGAVLTLRPFTSLSVLIVLVAASMIVTGVADLVEARELGSRLVGLGWIAAGIAVLVWPGATIRVITVFVGVAMIVSGALRLWAGIRGTREDLVTAFLSGAASVVFGVLALSWPDVTVLVIAVVFGARTVINGLVLLLAPRQARDRRLLQRAEAGAGRTWAVAAHRGVRHGRPGDGPGVAHPLHDHPRRGRACAVHRHRPGQQDRTGRTAPGGRLGAWNYRLRPGVCPVPAKGPIWLRRAAGSGPDHHAGLGAGGHRLHRPRHQRPAPVHDRAGRARSVLDAVRAARQLQEVSLSDKTVVWGHSQGGHSALWTGQIAPTYAADVPLAGVVAMAPASDLIAFDTNLDTMIGGSVFESFIVTAYSALYPDVHFDSYVRPAARTIVARAAGRCLSEPSTLVSVATSLALDKSIFATPVTQGALDQRLEQNTPIGPIQAPLLIAQGEADQIVLSTMQRNYTHRLCSAGQALDYRPFPGLDHVGLVGKDSPFIAQLISWTEDRLAAKPAASTCAAV